MIYQVIIRIPLAAAGVAVHDLGVGAVACCAGSSRLYEDPDVDEYGTMDDVGYVRRSITNQQDFIMSQLDFLRVRFIKFCLEQQQAHSMQRRG